MKFKLIIAAMIAAIIAVPDVQAAKKRKAVKSKVKTEELMLQARQAFNNYDVELSREKIAALRADKKSDKTEVDALERRVNRLDDMIQRVEDVAVIDTFNVAHADFFRAYRLSSAAGSILSAAELDGEIEAPEGSTVYMPEDGSLMMWGGPEGLMQCMRLTDGTWEAPVAAGDVLNAGGTASYPFLLPDGTTLYYATDGDDTLGGLDLYISQRNREGFAVPQNMGMPYNSPYNDFLLAIDEETGAGWFASDRSQLADSVTVYVFVPSESRVNLDVDRPDLIERARISTLSLPLSGEHKALLQAIAAIPAAGQPNVDDTPDFLFPLPDGRVYTRWSDFRSAPARRLMENYVDALSEFEADEQMLNKLRRNYRPGNRDADSRILAFEKKINASRMALRKLANQVISAEVK